ncbi:MAG: RNA-binding S4 domain-containing protein [bacterium]|nr:RNA-binding S4 domain-containing protein [bacterium]
MVDSGADAKEMVMAQQVKLNGVIELRKRAQIKAGDTVTTATHTILVEQGPKEK